MDKKSGTTILKEYLESHVGEEIPIRILNDVCDEAGLHHWDRVLRNMRQQEGYDIVNKRKQWYKLRSLERREVIAKRGSISKKLRFQVLERDNYTCQACGRKPSEDNIKLTMDHIIPVEWGGLTNLENLQAYCSECNEGKQAWINGEDAAVMKEVSLQSSTTERLRVYFNAHPNEEISVDRLAVVAQTREWTRQIRLLRQKYCMNILPRRKNKKEKRDSDTYIFLTEE